MLGKMHRLSEGQTYYGSHIGKLLVWENGNGLDEELVAAAGVKGRVFFHGLEEDYRHG